MPETTCLEPNSGTNKWPRNPSWAESIYDKYRCRSRVKVRFSGHQQIFFCIPEKGDVRHVTYSRGTCSTTVHFETFKLCLNPSNVGGWENRYKGNKTELMLLAHVIHYYSNNDFSRHLWCNLPRTLKSVWWDKIFVDFFAKVFWWRHIIMFPAHTLVNPC